MGKVNIDQLEPGMRLAQDVLAPNGRKLLPQGRIIEKRHIQTCKAWGVTEAAVAEENDTQDNARPQVSQQTLKQAKDLLQPFFQLTHTKKEPLKTIFNLALQQAALQLAQGQKNINIRHIPSPTQLKQLANSEPEDLDDPETIFEEEIQLLTLPDIYHRIVEILNSPRSSAVHVAEVVSKDSSLSAKLLKLVNSPFYGFNTKVDTITRAIALLGVNKLVTLAQGIAVVRVFSDIPAELVDMQAFWKHSVGCGVLAKLLAAQKAGLEEERFFVAGLLHDIGRLIMFKKVPRLTSRAILLSLQKKKPLYQAERQVLKCDHTQIGQQLCFKWLLPQTLNDMISFHHSPLQKAAPTVEAGLVHTADILCHAMALGSSGNILVPDMDTTIWSQLQISNSALQPVLSQFERQIHEISNIFLDKD